MIDFQRYTLLIRRSAEKEMDALSSVVLGRITQAILSLETDPHPAASKKLSGSDKFRMRVGDYRILYTVDDHKQTIEIVSVGHRRDVYRGR